jgi:hypothetical protein
MDFERLNGDIKEMRRRNRGLGSPSACWPPVMCWPWW